MVSDEQVLLSDSYPLPNHDLGKACPATSGPQKVGIIVNTPAQVHFYRNIYKQLIEDGHEAFIVARDYGETLNLLREYSIPHSVFSIPPSSKIGKVLGAPMDLFNILKFFKKNRIDLVTGFGFYDAYSSAILGIPNIVFSDNEPKIGVGSYDFEFKLFYPFVDHFITPSYFREDLGEKHIKINGIKELAYLHPNYYEPDESILEDMGLSHGDRYTILRFNGLDAFHDMGVGGFSREDKVELVTELERYGDVFISSEAGVPREIVDRVIKIPKNRIHDALFYASLLVTDTQTMATEAAILGTPTVRCNSFVGPNDMGNFIELEKQYNLLCNYTDSKDAMARAVELIGDNGIKAEWGRRKEALLNDKVDVSAVMTSYIENYPESFD